MILMIHLTFHHMLKENKVRLVKWFSFSGLSDLFLNRTSRANSFIILVDEDTKNNLCFNTLTVTIVNIHDLISDFPSSSFVCSWDISMKVTFHNRALYFWYGYRHQSICDFTSYAQITVTGEKITSNYRRQRTTFWLISISCYVKRWLDSPVIHRSS